MPAGEWQVRFDGGHQQRYLPDRSAVLRYVLAVGPHAASPRFEVFADAGGVQLADGSAGGRRFDLVEVIDLSRPGATDRLREELGDCPAGQPRPDPAEVIDLSHPGETDRLGEELGDRSAGGPRSDPAEVIDLSHPGEADRLGEELGDGP